MVWRARVVHYTTAIHGAGEWLI
ncbi:hypothetical protein IEO21_08209 [Rhodonia placenta]|uniref:Uncharacterized protein n=1 Tax=Rhodonia placenta TaxID=104341 RepID=A0A8H7NX17_9APHY|nr:hypothetical protein IEO21_08209 [Postia placenta]